MSSSAEGNQNPVSGAAAAPEPNEKQIATQNTAKNFAEQLRNSKPGPFPGIKEGENPQVKNTGPGATEKKTPQSLQEALKQSANNAQNAQNAQNTNINSKNEEVAAGNQQADGTTKKSDMPRYFYTQSEFWGAPTLSYIMYAILAIFPLTGFLGLDHMYMRSPGTGLAKLVFNFLSLGMWYFYDVIQAVKDKEEIYKYGVSMPLYGPSGIGAGSFIPSGDEEENNATNNTNNSSKKNGAANGVANGAANGVANGAAKTNGAANGAANGAVSEQKGATMATKGQEGGGEEEKKVSGSAISFMLYSFLTFIIPFGFEYLAAGDFKGFVAKFLLTFIGIGLIIGLLNIIKLISHPEQVLCEGTSRKLMPFIAKEFKEAYFVKEGCGGSGDSGESSGGWFSGLFNNLVGRVPILREIYAVTKEVASAAGKGVTALKDGTKFVTGVASAAAKMGGGGAQQVEVVRVPTIKQLGGVRAEDGFSGTILSFTLALVFIGAAFLKGKDFVAAAANRTTERPAELGKFLWRKKNVDDLPPAAPEPGFF